MQKIQTKPSSTGYNSGRAHAGQANHLGDRNLSRQGAFDTPDPRPTFRRSRPDLPAAASTIRPSGLGLARAQVTIAMSQPTFESLRRWFAPTDEQLMWRVQTADDAQAFAALVGRWQARIARLCTRFAGDAHRAEDLTQEVFSKVFARRRAYDSSRRFSTYLWRVAVNHCSNHLRSVRARPEHACEPLDPDRLRPAEGWTDAPLAPDEHLSQSERAAAVREALARLPAHQRAVVILRHFENLKFREIADVLELPEGTVKTRMAEALNGLARSLEKSLELDQHPRLDRSPTATPTCAFAEAALPAG
ncbi:MAG: sigma-70 family RNA polymerase sigma factor [Verrucomicrobia bacterium]|nr:sigma-70 family RNA polymerase sigma factor [Verrucomicrobiota bacterium]